MPDHPESTSYTDEQSVIYAAWLNAIDNTVLKTLQGKTTPAEIRTLLSAQPFADILASIAALASSGLLARAADGTVAARTITAGDGISVANGDGGSAAPQVSADFGSTSTTVCAGDDSRLSDSRAPTAHAVEHKSGGDDALKLDELAAPTDVTTLNASASAHGLLPKLSGNDAQFLNGQGAWASASGAHTHSAADLTDEGDFYAKTRGTGLSDTTGTIAVAYGSTSTTACVGDDARLSDARAPTAHAASHKTSGDVINVTELGGFTTARLAGRTTAGSGVLEAITVSANLSLSAGALDVVGPVASALGLTGAVSVSSLTEDTTPDKAADFLCAYDASASGHKKVKPQNLIPYDVLCGVVGKPTNAEVVLLFVAPRAFRIPANAAGSYLKAGAAATGSSVFNIAKNGSNFLTATVAGSGTTATFSSSQTDFAAGDVLKITAPSTADATLADIALTLAATLL